MKTFAQLFSISALTVLSVVSFANNDNNNANKTKTFEVGMFKSKNSLNMNLMLEKVTDKKVKIILKDPSGKVLHQEYVAKNTPSYYGKFDMSQLEDGVYTFEITDGTEKIIKTVNLQSPETQETTRNLTVNK
ncbi:hypothetical protein [Flectobacillus sp. BAB-3569]|uniref:hypothetical protein n=1 Tax=Flectobacillus sp. BAB-3569 TaxID=1509483 RepID=UPI000BA3A8BC|nr:hypothetical protein [Flectobacillus sp. BAB-3569]PAC28153.1 hypothetical protein BWI92_20345 [Flectobacillus sp. BAB-3569]